MKHLKKKKSKYKYINGTKGVISLFLCLIMTPVLSIASALIEFSRYQNTESVFQEVMDCASLSTMAHYDKYLQERFGLFAISQDCNINETYKNSLMQNSRVMEGITLGNGVRVSGTLPLSENDVIKRQILDFSESTVLTEIILEDLQLQKLLDELDKLMNIGGLTQTLSDMNTMTTKTKELVETGEAFVEKLNTATLQVESLIVDVNTFTSSLADLYKKINEDGFTIDSSTPETETTSLEAIVGAYLSDIQTVYNNAQTLINSVNALKETVVSLPDSLNALRTDYDETVEAVKAVTESFSNVSQSSNTGSSGQGSSSINEVSDDVTSLYTTLLNEIDKAIDEAAESLSTSTIDAFKTAANGLSNNLVDGLGLDVTKRWNLAEYYKLPLSDEAKEDIKDILSELPEVWTDGSYDGIVQTLKDKYVPSVLFMNFSKVKYIVSDAVNEAKTTFVDRVESSVGDILTTLVNTINGLFDLDVFYDGSLNAYLDEATISTLLSDSGYRGGEEDNPYVNLLNAISSMLSAVNHFTESIGNWDFFAMLSGISDLITSIKETVTSIVNLTAKTVQKINELVSWVKNGDWEKFGELLLMAGYMTHNLPNRTLVDKANININQSIEYNTILKGATLTGFQYADIPTPSKAFSLGVSAGKQENESSIGALASFMNGSLNSGTDKMFRGAELEYILAGTPSEIMNQAVVFMQIYFLRLLLDLVPVFTDPAVTSMAASASIACWAVYLIEAFAEPLCDTVLLVNGSEDVCFIKRSCYLTPTGADELVNALSKIVTDNETVKNSFKDSLSGQFGTKVSEFSQGILKMGYDTHCMLILMFTTTTDDMLRRLANIAQLEANYHYAQNGASFTFDVTNAYTGISAYADVEFDSFIKIFQTNNSSSLVKKEFTRTQTY